MKRKKSEGSDRQNMKTIWHNNFFALKICFEAAPFYTFYQLLNAAMVQAIVFVEHTYMISFIVDAIQYQKPFRTVAAFILSVFLFIVTYHLFMFYYNNKVHLKAMEKISRAVRLKLYDKASTLDIACYDNPEFYNDFVWAMGEANGRITGVLGTFCSFSGALGGILTLGTYLLTANLFGFVFVLLALACTLVFQPMSNKRTFRLDEKLRPNQRKREYINRLFYLSDYAKDLRLADLNGKLFEDYAKANEQMAADVEKESKKIVFFQFLSDFLGNTFLFDGMYIIYLLYSTIVRGVFGYGTMVALYRSSQQLKGSIQSLTAVLPQFQQNSLYVEKIKTFLNYKSKLPDTGSLPMPQQGDLVLDHVSFAYQPDGEKVLDDISLTIHQGEKVALVGYNGAGKTTLVKLLMRLYDPTQGRIIYAGSDVRRYPLEKFRKAFGTVFQDYQIFAATLGQNIAMDDKPVDRERAEEAMRQSEFYERYLTLEQGLDTQLTKEFCPDGVNLSGGEAQKIAISRALYQDSPIIILDEPSSALDPIAEYRLNHTVRELAGDKTVVFISHRLSTTRMADRILMLEQGRVIEEGSHDQLIRMNGKYAQMFRLQAQKYR